jgi:hypothetical protein
VNDSDGGVCVGKGSEPFLLGAVVFGVAFGVAFGVGVVFMFAVGVAVDAAVAVGAAVAVAVDVGAELLSVPFLFPFPFLLYDDDDE